MGCRVRIPSIIYNFLAHCASPAISPDYPRIQPIFPLGFLLLVPEPRVGRPNDLTMVRQQYVRQSNGHALYTGSWFFGLIDAWQG
jgi:hypothetical protein